MIYAGEAKTMKYASATYGSLAYDLGRVAQPEAYPKAPPLVKPRRISRERIRVEARPKTKTASKQGVSLFAAVGFALAAVLLVVVVMGYIRIAVISADSAALQERLSELSAAEAKLKIQYESTFNLNEIEAYAVKELGMVPASGSQVYYINRSSPDKAEILASGSKGGILSGIGTFLSGVVEYFG